MKLEKIFKSVKDDEYPIHAFPLVISKAIRKTAFYHNVPLAVAGQAYIGEMAYIAQSKFDAPSDKSEDGQPCSLFVLTIFPSGEGKDVCKNDAGKISRKIDSENMHNFQIEYDNWQYLPKKEKREPPKNPISVFKKATTHGILSAMASGESNSFIWSTGEGAYLFSGYSLKSETVGESLSILNDLVDTGKANNILKNADNNEYFDNKRFSLDISVQDVIAKPALHNDLLREQGFLARVLFAAPQPLPHKQITMETRAIKPHEDEDLKNYWKLCEKILTTPYMKDRNTISNGGRILVKKTKDAERRHIDYENYIGTEVEENGKYYYIRAYANRTKQYVLRVATIFAFFEEKELIDEVIMLNAIDICIYSLNQWIEYYDKTEKSQSDILLDWLKKQKEIKILKSSINQRAPKSLRNKVNRDAAIENLIDLGFIRIEKIGNSEYVVMQ